ncbi:MAG: class II aldolase/adducin family protein [Candidatus Jordarchaeaceae archaeon]
MDDVKQKLREELVMYGNLMLEKGLVVGKSGNLSVRVPNEDTILITPSMVEYPTLKPRDIPMVDLEGKVLEGTLPPSTEKIMHLAVYKARKDVGAVIHAHPIYGTVLGVVGKSLPPLIDEMVIRFGGQVEVAEYKLAGTAELAESAVRGLGNRTAVFLANHGTLCCGKDLKEAFNITEFLERMSQIYVFSLLLGNPRMLPEDSIKFEKEVYNYLHKT